MEELLREAFKLGQQWVKDINDEKEPVSFTEWFSKQLILPDVSGSLLEIDLIDWDHTCGDGCCYTYGQDITLNGEKLNEQNAEDSKNALTAVLTKLGYNVEINYR